jgi:glycine/D-amino acid oxidase-like deaminating enzyme
MPQRIVIIGAGIKGSILAALLSLAGADVTLVDRAQVGSGATSTNHGRLHLGTSSWRTDPDPLIRRRLAASALMRSLPHVISHSKDGLYCFETEEDAGSFLAVCSRNGIPFRECSRHDLSSQWVTADDFAMTISLPEYSFDPAKLAGRFASLAEHQGARLALQENIREIRDANREHLLDLSDGSKLRADLVINCGSRWSQDLIARHANVDLTVDWYTWRILCARAESLPPLERVTVIMDAARNTPSALPHGDWITIDGRSKPELLKPCDEPANYGWHRFDESNDNERKLYEDASRYLAPLRSLGPAAIFSFAGVQGRVRGAPPGSTNTVYFGGADESYAIAFGGQASTAFLDALEITEAMGERGWIKPVSRSGLISSVLERLPINPVPMTSAMIWNRVSS